MSSENEHRQNDEEENDSQNFSENYKYGWGIIQPHFLQKRLNNAKAFLVLLTLANVLQGITTNGILKVSVTSIERRFNLLSSESGLIISGYDIAGCIALLPISYLGGKGHKPRWIGIGLMLTSLGSFMISLPHFLTGPYEYTNGISSLSKENLTGSAICKPTSISTKSGFQNTSDSLSLINCEEILSNLGPYISINQMKYVLLIGQFITGVGCTPLAVLAVTFIDESVDPQVYPIYIGVYYMGALIGPAIGFIVGGQLLKIFTELGVTPEDINPESPQWVGAWWVGFLISAIVMFILAIPILGYPKKLPSNFTRKLTMVNIKGHQYSPGNGNVVRTVGKNRVASDPVYDNEALCQIKPNNENNLDKEQAMPLHVEELPGVSPQSIPQIIGDDKPSQFGVTCKHLQDFFRDFIEVVTNKAFMYLSISAAVLGTLVSGFSTFGPKFVESQFGKSASEAANLFGYVCIPAGAGGMLVGAFLMSGLKLGYKSSLRMCFCVSLLGLFGQFALTLHCDDIPMAGINVPYNNGDLNDDVGLNPDSPTDTCNQNCGCSSRSFDPVCGSDRITYYSACHAGCSQTSKSNLDKIFSNCSCIIKTIAVEIDTNISSENSLIAHSEAIISVQEIGNAVQGSCFQPCYWHDIILVGLFLVISTTFICVVPSVDLSLRCFPQELRSLAVGIQWILIRTLGTIPGPIIFGAMIDSTCLIWNSREQCSEGPGACVMYKNQELSFSILILSVIYKGASILFFGLALLSYTPARLVVTPSSPGPHRQVTGPSGESLL